MNRPPLSITIGEKTIKFTYGLQVDLQRLVPDLEQAMSLLTSDSWSRDFFVRRLLTDTAKSVTDEKDLIDHELVTLDPDEILDLLDWAVGHLIYFFGKSASTAARHGTEVKDLLTRLTQSQTGSESSASTTESAGPSA